MKINVPAAVQKTNPNKPNFKPSGSSCLKADPYYLKVACLNAANFSAPQMSI
jgi:hypothetical protein